MSSFPSEEDMAALHERIVALVGCSAEVRDPEMLRAVLLGVRLSRRGGEIHRGPFERAAALILEIVNQRPYREGNRAAALAGALLYLSRHGKRLAFAPGQARSLMEGTRKGSMDEIRLASLLRLRAVSGKPAATR